MPYLYMLQPVEYINTNCYKIGLSSTCDLNRLKSYGSGTKYIQYFECNKYREAEKELICKLNEEQTIALFKGREYFCGEKQTILNIFIEIMLKYNNLEAEKENIEKVEYVEDEEIEKVEITVRDEKKIKQLNLETNTKSLHNDVRHVEKNKYVCKVCKFSCMYQSDFNRHLNSKKHKYAHNNRYLCAGCNKELSNKFNKDRHEKNCNKIIRI